MEKVVTFESIRKEKSNDSLLSIIIPIYNAEKYLKICIDSILQQTYTNFELLLIDDGSKDSSSQICDEYALKDSRIRAIHKENGGCSSARNMGIELSKGEVIAFVDADDYLDPDMYQILMNNLLWTDSDVSVCSYKREKESQIPNIEKNHDSIPDIWIFTEREIYDSITRHENGIAGMVWNKVWKREVVGEHRYRKDVAINDDAVFTWETLKDAKQVCLCSIPMYHYVIIPTGIVRSSKLDNYLKGVHGYEIMMQDVDTISESCYAVLSYQYIVWNVTAFEHLVMQKKPDKKIYERIKQNIISKKKYMNMIKTHHKYIAILITKNYTLAKAVVKIKRFLKKLQ